MFSDLRNRHTSWAILLQLCSCLIGDCYFCTYPLCRYLNLGTDQCHMSGATAEAFAYNGLIISVCNPKVFNDLCLCCVLSGNYRAAHDVLYRMFNGKWLSVLKSISSIFSSAWSVGCKSDPLTPHSPDVGPCLSLPWMKMKYQPTGVTIQSWTTPGLFSCFHAELRKNGIRAATDMVQDLRLLHSYMIAKVSTCSWKIPHRCSQVKPHFAVKWW